MAEYDGEIRIKTLIENGEASSKLMQMESQFQKLAREADKLSNTLKKLASQKIPTEEYKAVQMQIEKDTASLGKLTDRMDKFLETGGSSESTTFKRMQYDVEKLTNSIKYAKGELEEMESLGTAFIDPTTTEEYSKVSEKLLDVQSKQEALNQKMRETVVNEKSIGAGAKDIEKVGKSAKKSSGLISDMAKHIKQTVVSFAIFGAVMKVSQTISKAFTEGIQNMAKYSSEFNGKMSEMASASATLKNSIGALTAPIISALTPAIVTLCTWLTNAINAMNRFIAAISGKSTWTKAKKQQVDYAASLDKTAGSAKKAAGALAAFDDLNVLQKNDSGSGSGGTGSGGSDLYEEVPTGKELSDKIQPFIDYLKKLKVSIKNGWDETWSNLDISLQFDNIKSSIESIKNSFLNIFSDSEVSASADNFAMTFSRSLGSISASVVSIGATIAENLLGGISIYLESNSENIKNYIIDMFDIASDISVLASQGADAFANVFSVFGDENGQQITANLIQIFSDAFMMVTENAAKFGKDIIDCIVTPFVENQDALKDALDGLLVVISDLTTTISDGVQHVTDKITELYDEHIHPFIENVKNGMSELIAKFLEFWNTYVQPILQNLALMFEDTYENHLKPVFDNIFEIMGIVIDILNDLWTNILQPIIAWIIENVLPVILPIIKNLSQNIKDSVDFILDLINFLLAGVKLVFAAIHALLTKDTDKALRQTEKSVKDFVNSVIQMFENMVNRVINGINSLISGFNSIGFDMPDWLGGGSWHPSIPTIPTVKLPRLANGGITTGRTLAEIGEAGREAVLPLENNTGWMDDLASKLASKMPDYSGAKTVVLAVDGKEFARINLPYLQDEEIRLGIAEG
nr:MAG TPA: minor tail protein [Caudoviricetes sp.]